MQVGKKQSIVGLEKGLYGMKVPYNPLNLKPSVKSLCCMKVLVSGLYGMRVPSKPATLSEGPVWNEVVREGPVWHAGTPRCRASREQQQRF